MLILQSIRKSYEENNPILENFDLEIKDRSFSVIVGPSGCGKTTTLRAIAGLEVIDSGNIILDGKEISGDEPGERNLAMVFQNYAIYPHLSVRDNIEFGLKNYQLNKEEISGRSDEVLRIVGLDNFSERLPNTLSGGQRQRVALSRAISKSPKVFLMDEPLSNLDAKLRNEMRTQLIQLHQSLDNIFIYVTHDQTEALSMGTDIIVMNEGKIMQQGSPEEVFANPNNIFVAQFIGDPGMNIILTEDAKYIGFRPFEANFDPIDNAISVPGNIITREFLGEHYMYSIDIGKGIIKVKSTMRIESADLISLFIPKDKIFYFDNNGNRCDAFTLSELKEVYYEGANRIKA